MDTMPKLMDHNKYVESLCCQVEAGRLDATSELCAAWHCHARADVDIVYPSLPLSNLDAVAMQMRATTDHRLIDRLVVQIERTSVPRESYAACSGLLVRLIREHVVAEELSVFPVLMFQEG